MKRSSDEFFSQEKAYRHLERRHERFLMSVSHKDRQLLFRCCCCIVFPVFFVNEILSRLITIKITNESEYCFDTKVMLLIIIMKIYIQRYSNYYIHLHTFTITYITITAKYNQPSLTRYFAYLDSIFMSQLTSLKMPQPRII